MKRILRVIVLFLLFCLTLIPSEAFCVSTLVQNIPSQDYIVTQKHAEITLVQGEEDYYVVSENNSRTEVTNSNKKNDSTLIFGEDAITEDNLLKHYVFSKDRLEKNRAYHKISPTLKNTINTRAP